MRSTHTIPRLVSFRFARRALAIASMLPAPCRVAAFTAARRAILSRAAGR